MSILAVTLGAVIGAAFGLLGGGGSILTVPIFVYALGAEAKPAIAMSLAVVAVTSAIGALGHWRAGNVNLRTGVIFAGVAMIGTVAGTRLSTYIPGLVQLTMLAVMMVAAALVMLRGRRESAGGAPRFGLPTLAACAAGVGALTGLVGIGGGFLIVPALVGLGVPMREAVGSSLAIICVNAVTGFFGLVGRVPIDWRAVALVAAGTVPGIAAGVSLQPRVSQSALRRAFALFLIAIAVFMLWQQSQALG